MSDGQSGTQLNGFMILPLVAGCAYRGVDRSPFEPLLLDEEIDPLAEITPESKVSDFYPKGWRHEAYDLYERKSLVSPERGPSLLASRDAAEQIVKLLPPALGPHEILHVSVLPINGLPFRDDVRLLGHLVGYDVAYPGGDYYSAVRNAFVSLPNHAAEAAIGERDFDCFSTSTSYSPRQNQLPTLLRCLAQSALGGVLGVLGIPVDVTCSSHRVRINRTITSGIFRDTILNSCEQVRNSVSCPRNFPAVSSGQDLLTAVTSVDGTVNYSYDPTGQLTGATYSAANGSASAVLPNESYAYDANGNPTGSGHVVARTTG